MRAEPTAKVGTMSTRIGEDHVVSDRNNIKSRIGRDPGRRPSMVAEKVCCVCRKQPHDCTFFINVLAVRSNALGRVDHRSVSFSRGSAWLDVDREVTISMNTR